MKVYFKNENFEKNVSEYYANEIEMIVFLHFMIFMVVLVSGLFFLMADRLVLFSLIHIANIVIALIRIIWSFWKKDDFIKGTALLKQAYLDSIEPGKFITRYYFCEYENGFPTTEKILRCFECTYNASLDKNEMIVDCQNKVIEISCLHLLR